MSKLTIRFPFMMRIMVVLAPVFLAYAFLSSKSVKPTTAVVLAAPMAGAIHASAYQVEVTRTGVSISFFPFVSRGRVGPKFVRWLTGIPLRRHSERKAENFELDP